MKEVDAINEWFGFGKVKIKKVKNSSGIKQNKQIKRSSNDGAANAMKRAAKKSPEVMVKVTGGGKGVKEAKKHLDYISRNGEVSLENQDGETINGKEGVGDVRDEWRAGGMPEEGRHREVFNFVLSMPEGTPREPVLIAAREFAAQEFSGHKYVLAEHRDEDHPHVHIAVVARGMDGTKLNPRKDDLFRWRVEFASKLRDQGVDANATRRTQRLGKKAKTEHAAVRQIRAESEGDFKHGRKKRTREAPIADQVERKPLDPKAIEKQKAVESKAAKAFGVMAGELFRAGDIEGAKLLDQYVSKNHKVVEEDQKTMQPEEVVSKPSNKRKR